MVSLYPFFVEWHAACEPDEDIDGLAEDFGFLMREYRPNFETFEKRCTAELVANAVGKVSADTAAPNSQDEIELCERVAEEMLQQAPVFPHFRMLNGVESLRTVLVVERHKMLGVSSIVDESKFYFEHYSKLRARVKRAVAHREDALHARRGWSAAESGAKAF